MPSPETQAALTALLSDPEMLRAHAPAIARRIAAGIMQVPGVVVLGDIDGMVVLYPEGSGFDAHFLFPKWARGAKALRRIREIFGAAFAAGAAQISGEIAIHNRASQLMARWTGAAPVGTVENEDIGPAIRYVLTREAFLQKHPATPT